MCPAEALDPMWPSVSCSGLDSDLNLNKGLTPV